MSDNGQAPKLWTTLQVAEYIGCTVRHLQNLMTLGLPHIKVGRLVRFDPVELMEFLRRNRGVQDSGLIE